MLPDLFRSPSKSLSRGDRDVFNEIQSALNRVFEDFGQDMPKSLTDWQEGSAFNPRLDFQEKDNEIVMTAELPGLKESDVQVEVEDDCLCVRGEKREEKEEKNGGRYFSERRYGSFERIVRLPADADKDKINAQLTDGILKVTIPKAPGHKNQKKKIAIKH